MKKISPLAMKNNLLPSVYLTDTPVLNNQEVFFSLPFWRNTIFTSSNTSAIPGKHSNSFWFYFKRYCFDSSNCGTQKYKPGSCLSFKDYPSVLDLLNIQYEH